MNREQLEKVREDIRVKKVLSDEAYLQNSIAVRKTNQRINEIQDERSQDLDQFHRDEINGIIIKNLEERQEYDKKINELNLDDPSSEPTQATLYHEKLSNDVEMSKKIGNILDYVKGNLPGEAGVRYDTFKIMRDDLLEANKAYLDIHLDIYNYLILFIRNQNNNDNNKDNNINNPDTNKGSLIDDYADPNLDQPSYTEPED